jgi:hypothetical protein
MSEWIDVKQKLPPVSCCTVLTFSEGMEIPYAYRIICYGVVAKGFPSEVTHWQPLPEPPK